MGNVATSEGGEMPHEYRRLTCQGREQHCKDCGRPLPSDGEPLQPCPEKASERGMRSMLDAVGYSEDSDFWVDSDYSDYLEAAA